MGKFPTVAIYDYNVAKELFSQEDLTGRPDNFAYRFRTLGKRQGKLWVFENFHLFRWGWGVKILPIFSIPSRLLCTSR